VFRLQDDIQQKEKIKGEGGGAKGRRKKEKKTVRSNRKKRERN
jgi:hypothetical protein